MFLREDVKVKEYKINYYYAHIRKTDSGGNFDIVLSSSFFPKFSLRFGEKTFVGMHGGKTLSSPFFFPNFFPSQIRENDISSYLFPLLFFMFPKIPLIKESSNTNTTNPYHSY